MFFIIITYLELAYLVLRFLLNFRIPWFHQILEALKDEEELNRIINTRKERKKQTKLTYGYWVWADRANFKKYI